MNRSHRQQDGTRNQNPGGITLAELLKEDYETYEGQLTEPGLWAVWVHRLGNWRMGIRQRAFRLPFTVIYQLMQLWVHWVWGIKLDYVVKVGRRFRIWHHGGIILGAAEIGDDVHVRQNTTLGVARRGTLDKPVLEDGVDVGCGAVILGKVRVGRGSIVGANAVVVKHVPAGAVAVGIPAKIRYPAENSKCIAYSI